MTSRVCHAFSSRGVSKKKKMSPASLLLVFFGVAWARPTVRELRSHKEYEALLSHHATQTGLPVVVDFYSNSCGPCRMIAPVFKRIAEEYKDRVVFAKVNVETNRDTSSRLRIASMPTFHFYLDGKKKREFSGAGEGQLRQFTEMMANDASRNNVALTMESLTEYYKGTGKSEADVKKIYDKCASMSKGGQGCVGGAARELAKKLKEKFGSAPTLGSRFTKTSSAPEEKKKPTTTSSKAASLSSASVEQLLAELAKRDDEAALAAVEAATLVQQEEEEEEDEGLPLYTPRKTWRDDLAERVVVLGGGPAGLSAAVYAARAGLSPIVVAPPGGGQLLGKGVTVENFPGVNATGPGLVVKMQEHAAHVGTVFYPHAVTRAHLHARPFLLETTSGANISAHAIVVATGANARWLGVPGEADFRGGGVSSCATCDGFLFRDKDVAVVGGGDAAMEDALVLARTSKSVTVVHRRDKFRASHALADRVLTHPNIKVVWNATVRSFDGSGGDEEYKKLTSVYLEDAVTGQPVDQPLSVSACFIAIGHDPNTAWLENQLKTDELGYLHLDKSSDHRFATQLSIPGVFAAGDVADNQYRQAITSAGTGAMAALDAERFLSELGLGVEPGAAQSDELSAEILQEILGLEDEAPPSINVYDTFDSKADILANAKSEL